MFAHTSCFYSTNITLSNCWFIYKRNRAMTKGMQATLLFCTGSLLPLSTPFYCQFANSASKLKDSDTHMNHATIQSKQKHSHNNVALTEALTGPVPYNLYVWTAFTAMILSLGADGAPCPLDCPPACALTLGLSPWCPFFGCLGAVYVSDVLPSCDDFPTPNSDASFELQYFERGITSTWIYAQKRNKHKQVQPQASSHLEPSVKSSSSSPWNMLRCNYRCVTPTDQHHHAPPLTRGPLPQIISTACRYAPTQIIKHPRMIYLPCSTQWLSQTPVIGHRLLSGARILLLRGHMIATATSHSRPPAQATDDGYRSRMPQMQFYMNTTVQHCGTAFHCHL